MDKINVKRIALGGMLAALVLSVLHGFGEWLAASQIERTVERLGLSAPGEAMMLVHLLGSVVIGVVAVWLYVILRPVYGPRPHTALLAGVVVWVLACLVPNAGMAAMGMLTPDVAATLSAIDLVVFALATLAGASIYRDVRREALVAAASAG
jgi:hypothetical protein